MIKNRVYTKETIVKALIDYKNGVTYSEILKKYNVKDNSVLAGWARKANIERPDDINPRHNWEDIEKEVNK
jgi:hypothetical protein